MTRKDHSDVSNQLVWSRSCYCDKHKHYTRVFAVVCLRHRYTQDRKLKKRTPPVLLKLSFHCHDTVGTSLLTPHCKDRRIGSASLDEDKKVNKYFFGSHVAKWLQISTLPLHCCVTCLCVAPLCVVPVANNARTLVISRPLLITHLKNLISKFCICNLPSTP